MDLQLTLYTIGYILLLILLVCIENIPHTKSGITKAELTRRQKKGDKVAKALLTRDTQYTNILTIRSFLYIVALLSLVALGQSQLGYLQGIFLALLLAIVAHVLSAWSFATQGVEKLYAKYELHINTSLDKLQPLLKIFYGLYKKDQRELQLHSPEELQDMLKQSDDVFSPQQKQLLLSALKFEHKTVADIMTVRKDIKTIDKKELLGPLVLDDLHKVGHTHVPVVHRNTDHIVGILRVDDILSTESKQSTTVERAMQLPALYLYQYTNLAQAVAAFLHTGSPLFIVVDESKKTVGLVSLVDVLQTLVGTMPDNGFDAYGDIETVIERHNKVQ